MNTIIIIPCFNDNKFIYNLIESILKNFKLDILIIDDGSTNPIKTDNTKGHVVLIRNKENKGKGYSIKKGLGYAKKNNYKHAITLDADLQHDPACIEKFLKIDSNIDLVIGRRKFTSDMPLHRRCSNRITSLIVSILSGKKILDSQSGYRRYRLSTSIFSKCIEDGFHFESEILINQLRLSNSSIEHVFIPTLYNDEKSSINNISDTYKFVKLIMRKIFV